MVSIGLFKSEFTGILGPIGRLDSTRVVSPDVRITSPAFLVRHIQSTLFMIATGSYNYKTGVSRKSHLS